MASRTQLRLAQMTGSFVDLKSESQQYVAPATAAALTGSDVQDLLGALAGAIHRIHGAASAEPFNNVAGTFSHDTITFDSSATTDPLVIIKNTTNDANGARLRFVKDKGAAGADNDVAGLIEFVADDANQDQVKFAEVKAQVKDATDGQEGGKLTLSVAEHDGTLTQGLLLSDGDADGEIDVTIGAAATSVTEVAGVLKVSGKSIQDDGGDERISLEDALVLKDADGTAVVTLHASDLSTTLAGDLTVAGTSIDVDSASALAIGASVGANNLTLGASDSTVVIAGNLDVNGSTTTIDTVNLSVQDSIIALGVSGSDGGYSASGDRGILFPRGADHSAVAGLWFDGTRFNLATTKTGPTSGSFAAVDSYNTLRLGAIDLQQGNLEAVASGSFDEILPRAINTGLTIDFNANDNLNKIKLRDNLASALDIKEGANSYLKFVTTNGSEAIVVDKTFRVNGKVLDLSADSRETISEDSHSIRFKANNANMIDFKGDGDAAILPLAAGIDLGGENANNQFDNLFLGDAGVIKFQANQSVTLTSAASSLTLNGTNALQFNDANIQIRKDASTNRMVLKTNNVDLVMPTNNGDAGQVLTTNGSGDLSFTTVGADAALKGVYLMTASHASDVDFSVNANGQSLAGSDAVTGLSQEQTQGRKLDVFVNGQLLLSGAGGSAPFNYDYEIRSGGNTLRFKFQLEEDDIVQVIKR